MRTFESLSEREILALAISQEEEDARIYDNFALQPTDSEQFPTWEDILTGTPDKQSCPDWNP